MSDLGSYAFILTISQLGLLHIIVRTFVTEHVESSALDTWKINILKNIDSRISLYCNNLDILALYHNLNSLLEIGRKGSRNSIGSLF